MVTIRITLVVEVGVMTRINVLDVGRDADLIVPLETIFVEEQSSLAMMNFDRMRIDEMCFIIIPATIVLRMVPVHVGMVNFAMMRWVGTGVMSVRFFMDDRVVASARVMVKQVNRFVIVDNVVSCENGGIRRRYRREYEC